jgi:hypothetical protein
MARISGLEPKIETIISNKTLSEHVMEFKKDVFQGLQYDTTLQLKGSVTVAGDTVGDFVADLKKLIEDYRI